MEKTKKKVVVVKKEAKPKPRPPILDGPVSVKKTVIPAPVEMIATRLIRLALARAKNADLEKIAGFASSIGYTDIEKIHKGRVTAWDDFARWLGGEEGALD
jgi:hypothetical protein